MIYILSKDNTISDLIADYQDEKTTTLKDIEKLRKTAGPSDIIIYDLVFFNTDKLLKISSLFLAVTDVTEYEEAVSLLRKGAKGYANRLMHKDNYFQAIHTIRNGQIWLPPKILSKMISLLPFEKGTQNPDKDFKSLLTSREIETAKLVTKGMSNTEISDELNISVRTVKAHLTSIFAKTGFRDRLELGLKMKDSF